MISDSARCGASARLLISIRLARRIPPPSFSIVGERSNSWAGRPPYVTLHHTRQQAWAELLDYVKRNWEDSGEEEPDEPDGMIEQYFDEVLEYYDIQKVQFSGAVAADERPPARLQRSSLHLLEGAGIWLYCTAGGLL